MNKRLKEIKEKVANEGIGFELEDIHWLIATVDRRGSAIRRLMDNNESKNVEIKTLRRINAGLKADNEIMQRRGLADA